MSALIVLLIFASVIGGLAFLFYWQFIRFDRRVFVKKPGSETYAEWKGRETLDKSGKIAGFEIKGYRKYSGNSIPKEYFVPWKKFMIRPAVFMEMDNDGNLIPQKPSKVEAASFAFKPISNWQLAGVAKQVGNAYRKYQKTPDAWMKWMFIIIVIGTVVNSALAAYSTSNMKKASETNAAAASVLAESNAMLIKTYYYASNNITTSDTELITPVSNVIRG